MDRRRASLGPPAARPRLSLGRSNGATRNRSRLYGGPGPNPVATGYGAVLSRKRLWGHRRVDTRTRETQKISVGNSPSAVATGAGGVWVTDDVDNTVARIDPASANAVTGSTPVGRGPGSGRHGAGAVSVANTQDDTVARVDPDHRRDRHHPSRAPSRRSRRGRRRGLGGEQPQRNCLADRPEDSSRRGDGRGRRGPAGRDRLERVVWVSVQQGPPRAIARRRPRRSRAPAGAAGPGLADPALASDFQRLSATCALLYNYPDRGYPEGARLVPEVPTGRHGLPRRAHVRVHRAARVPLLAAIERARDRRGVQAHVRARAQSGSGRSRGSS